MTGPHFDMGPPLEDEKGHKHWDPKSCVCGLTTYVDAVTGYCRECWRAWRFAADWRERANVEMQQEWTLLAPRKP